MRYLGHALQRDLQKKMVLLAGPRQCGKTTLAKSLLDARGQYFNWDIAGDRKIIREIAWPKDASLVVLDELHKAPKWKKLLKGVADELDNKPPVLVTGSARLDALRKAGDALTGRHYFYRLHPIDVAESARFLPELALALLELLLCLVAQLERLVSRLDQHFFGFRLGVGDDAFSGALRIVYRLFALILKVVIASDCPRGQAHDGREDRYDQGFHSSFLSVSLPWCPPSLARLDSVGCGASRPPPTRTNAGSQLPARPRSQTPGEPGIR